MTEDVITGVDRLRLEEEAKDDLTACRLLEEVEETKIITLVEKASKGDTEEEVEEDTKEEINEENPDQDHKDADSGVQEKEPLECEEGGEETVVNVMEEKEGMKVVAALDEEYDAHEDNKILIDEMDENCMLKTKEKVGKTGDGLVTIIDISDDDSESEEEEEVGDGLREMEIEEVSAMKIVDEILEETVIINVIEQDPQVIVGYIIDGMLDESLKQMKSKGEKQKTEYHFNSTDIRFRKTSASIKSVDSTDKVGLSLFLSSRTQHKISKFLKVLKSLKKNCCSEKYSAPRDIVRVDFLLRTNKDRSKLEREIQAASEGIEGLCVEYLESTEKELGMKEKSILTEDEIMWIYSEGKCHNLFTGFKVKVLSEKSGMVKFKFDELGTFLYCVLDRDKALLGRVRKEAKVHLPMRMKSSKIDGEVLYPVNITGANLEMMNKLQGKFKFKMSKNNPKNKTMQIDFQNSVDFYHFWISDDSRDVGKIQFSQISMHSD